MNGVASRIVAVIALAALVRSRPVDAFLYNEHRDVSNEALSRAASYLLTYGPPLDPQARRALEDLRVLDQVSPFSSDVQSFGDVAALVDYVSDPQDFLSRRGIDDPSRPVVPNLPPSDPEERLVDMDRLRVLKQDTLLLLSASHRDINHFQDGAMAAFWSWHRIAIATALRRHEIARTAGINPACTSLTMPLLYVAFAAHFLEDFFAPGHVLTPRRHLHDAAAMSLHDAYNRAEGADAVRFLVNVHALSGLKGLLSPVTATQLATSGLDHIPLSGDGRLASNPVQADFMAAVVARSIADVLEAFYLGRTANSFEVFRWEPYTLVRDSSRNRSVTRTPLARLPFGEYESRSVKIPALRLKPVLVLSAGFGASASGGGTSAHGRFDLGAVVWGSAGKGWREGEGTFLRPASFLQFGLAPLVTYTVNRDFRSVATGVRMIFPITKVDLQLDVDAQYVYATASGGIARRLAYGARLELGYGVAFVGIGVGQGVHWVPDAGFQSAWTFTSSVALTVPLSGIKKLFERDEGVPYPPR